jgi:hypothetical protein
MSLRLLEFMDFLKDNQGKILIAIGILLAVLGFGMQSTFYFVIPTVGFLSGVSLFLGIMLVVLGSFVHVGLFPVKWRSVDGLGTVLLCISVGFFALAIVAIQFQLVTGFYEEGAPSPGGGVPYTMYIPISERPFLFLFGSGLQFGLAFLVASLIFKAFAYFRS